MFFNRIGQHITKQNWSAICIEFVIVVVGVFLAFQVERLYEARRLQSEEQSHLVALRQDFEASRTELIRVIDIHQRSVNAASQLILDENFTSEEIGYDTFYQLLGDVQRTGTPNIARRTYDLLISSGKIDTLENEPLKADIASFYALFAGRESFQALQLLNFESNVFIPYVNQHLDHVALAKKLHTADTKAFSPSADKDHFRSVLGTTEFEGMVATKWHLSRDYKLNNEDMLKLLDEVLQALDQNLREFD
jgi:hypothetical protein